MQREDTAGHHFPEKIRMRTYIVGNINLPGRRRSSRPLGQEMAHAGQDEVLEGGDESRVGMGDNPSRDEEGEMVDRESQCSDDDNVMPFHIPTPCAVLPHKQVCYLSSSIAHARPTARPLRRAAALSPHQRLGYWKLRTKCLACCASDWLSISKLSVPRSLHLRRRTKSWSL